MKRDIIERLMDFDHSGLTAADRVNMRECAAIEIHKFRRETKLALGGLELLLAAVHANDPKREILVRIGDIMRELKSAPGQSAYHKYR